MTAMTRVVLVLPETLLRASLKSLLAAQPDIALIADVTSLDAAAAVIARVPVDIVLLHLDAAVDTWPNLLAKLNGTSSGPRLMLLSPARDAVRAAAAVEGGVRGVVYTDQAPEMLFKALRKVHAGEVWLERSSFVALFERRRRHEASPELAKIRSLTKREREIIIEVGKALKNRDVAERLAISEATVRNHLTSILDKLGLTDRTELALFGLRYGLVPCPACSRVHDPPERLGEAPEPRSSRLAHAFRPRAGRAKTYSAR
jgi:two-component system nitrate/nitrite response regulator NarL